jgi:hypothetical protein
MSHSAHDIEQEEAFREPFGSLHLAKAALHQAHQHLRVLERLGVEKFTAGRREFRA